MRAASPNLMLTNLSAMQYITLYGYVQYNVYRLYDYCVANNNMDNLGCSIFVANGSTAKKDVHWKYF